MSQADRIQKVESQDFAIAALEMENVKDVVRDNLSDMGRIQFERIKMPSGGGLAFEVSDSDGNPAATAEIVGVILDRFPVNAYWPDKYAGAKNPPACVAMDGHNGEGEPGGICSKCQLNQWGSDGEGRGKACKNLHRIYVLPPGDVLPLLIALPPTSLSNFNAYMMRLTSKAKKPYWTVVTKIRLEKASNAAGIGYSRAVFAKVGDVAVEKVAALKGYIEELRPLMRSVEVVADDYAVEGDSAEAGGEKPQSEPF